MVWLAGIVAVDGGLIDSEIEFRVFRAMPSSRGGPAVVALGGALFIQETPAAGGGGRPIVRRDGRELVAAVARLDNREELGNALGLAAEETARASDAALLGCTRERPGE